MTSPSEHPSSSSDPSATRTCWTQTNVHTRTVWTTTKLLSVGVRTQTCPEDLEVLPEEIISKAVGLVDYIDRVLLREENSQTVWNWLMNDFQTKVLILKDELHLYLMKTDQKHLQEKLSTQLNEYLAKKIKKVFEDAFDEQRLTDPPYHTFCSVVSHLVKLDRYQHHI